MAKRKIAVIGLKGLPAFGGAATVGENIIAELKNEYEFVVYSVSSHTNSYGRQDAYFQIVFKKFMFKRLNVFMYYLKALLHCVFFANYDLIHLHHIDGAFILPILRLKYKVICTSHAQPYVSDKWPGLVKLFFKMNEIFALNLSNTITTVSKTLWNNYQKRTKCNVKYIPNGINLYQKVNDQYAITGGYILFAAGRIIPLKGLHLLLQALKKIRVEKELLVIGNLEHMADYKRKIYKLSSGLNVKFIPLIREKEKLLAYVKNCDLFVFPSLSENMSIMLLEAASMKVNLVCSDICANTDVFNDAEAVFFRSGDSDDLALKIAFALKEKTEMTKKSIAAYRRLISEYNWEKIACDYSRLYNKLIEN